MYDLVKSLQKNIHEVNVGVQVKIWNVNRPLTGLIWNFF